jgi:catechol 2,3-dioxygenase-like lactoylglutathione lyase family enzyme
MKLDGLRWVGIATAQPEAMVGFMRDTLGMRVEFAEPTTTELSLRNGDRVQVFGPGNAYHDQYRSQGIVPLFELDDVHAARRELEEAGVEVGELKSDAAWEWVDVRGPDGRLYVLATLRTRFLDVHGSDPQRPLLAGWTSRLPRGETS